MPSPETSHRFQDAVLWPFSGYDQYGQATVSPVPVPLLVRWVDKQTEMLDPKNNTIAVDATVVVDRKIAVGGIMWKGKRSDLEIVGTAAPSPDGLMEVKAFNETSDARNRHVRRTVGLMRFRDKLPVNRMIATEIIVTAAPNPGIHDMNVAVTATVTGCVIMDHFVGPNGTELSNHMPTIGTAEWYKDATTTGVLQIQNNRVVAVSVPAVYLIDPGFSDGKIGAKFNLANLSGSISLIVRWTDDNNYWAVTLSGPANNLKIVETVAGNSTIRTFTPFSPVAGTDYAVLVTLNGSTISATIDGGNPISWGSATSGQTSSGLGLLTPQGIGFQFDDFFFSPLTPTPSGAVTFFDGTTLLGNAPLNSAGVATFTTSNLAVGGHSLQAKYKGDPHFAGSSSSIFSETVTP